MIDRILSKAKESNIIITNCYAIKKDKLYRDLYVISFTKLYPNILVQMYDIGLMPHEKILIESLREELKKPKSLQDNFFVNSYYGNLYYRNNSITDLLSKYLNVWYVELVSKYDIIYIDTDEIYVHDLSIIDSIKELDIPYVIEKINYIYIHDRKRYVISDDFGIRIKGRQTKDQTLLLMKNNIVTMIREDKLESIGI